MPEPIVDVRMRGFARQTPVEEALAWIDRRTDSLPSEAVPLGQAAGCVLAGDVVSQFDVPRFRRAMMDGYAARANELPGPLAIVGDALPGRAFEGSLPPGACLRITTGAPLPEEADVVIPVELTTRADDTIVATQTLAPNKHVGRVGEDVATGERLLSAGRLLTGPDVGLLSCVGQAEVAVARRPRVVILITGDELLPPGTAPAATMLPDSNGPMLAALIERDGGVVVETKMVGEDRQAMLAALRIECDVLLFSGASSVGHRDFVPLLLAEQGELAIHGIAMRPSKPTGLGRLDDRFVFLLPGNPVSCLCAYDFFAARAIRRLGGRSRDWPYQRLTGPLTSELVSASGRLDYVRVNLRDGKVEPLATGGASQLTSVTHADGFVIVPADVESLPAGQAVEVLLYRPLETSP